MKKKANDSSSPQFYGLLIKNRTPLGPRFALLVTSRASWSRTLGEKISLRASDLNEIVSM